MNIENNISTRLNIEGYTLNPIKDKHIFERALLGLFSYGDKHICDFDHKTAHNSYLKNNLQDPTINYINNEKYRGIISFCAFENGYFVLKIIDNVYPARVIFDLYIEEKMLDAHLIIDHLSAPAEPGDGFGIFDVTYSLTHNKKHESILYKDDKNQSSYILNKTFDFLEYLHNNENMNIILNKLKEIECFYCNSNASILTFIDIPRKLIPICENHKGLGSQKELNHQNNNEIDERTINFNKQHYVLVDVENKNNKERYTKNIKYSDIRRKNNEFFN